MHFPNFDPVILHLGPFAIRWYALAYIAGILAGWGYGHHLATRPALWAPRAAPLNKVQIDDLIMWITLGVILGGGTGYVLLYGGDTFASHPLEIFAVWKGGMAFHGGLFGAGVAIWLFARRKGFTALCVADLCAAVVPIGLALGRIANFIKPELWGRPTDVAWAMVFPDAGPVPRHPSQLYEAALEGVALFVLLQFAIRMGALKRPGLVTGLFGIGYGIARIVCEFFREPDPQLGFLFGGATMGMLLSVPLILIGIGLVAHAQRPRMAVP